MKFPSSLPPQVSGDGFRSELDRSAVIAAAFESAGGSGGAAARADWRVRTGLNYSFGTKNIVTRFGNFTEFRSQMFCNFSAILNEFWYFRTHLWNSEKISSKFIGKVAVVISKLRKFEWIEFSFTRSTSIQFYQNYDDFFAEILIFERCRTMTCRSRQSFPTNIY